jgi:hypothetical protein
MQNSPLGEGQTDDYQYANQYDWKSLCIFQRFESMRKLSFVFLIYFFAACTYHDLNNLNDVPAEDPFVCDPETSWQNDILPIMETSCAGAGCHDGISRRDWTDYDEVRQYATAIKQKTQDRSMPFDGPPLPQEQINIIECWVDAGAADN